MKYRRLGQWGIKLSEVGLGSWMTIRKGDQRLADALHRAAYENGINFFDTANVYARGEAEIMVGKALRGYKRDTYVLATKVFWPFQPDWPFPGVNDRGLSRKHIFEQCHASLQRLGLDYIDLYQCHRFDPEAPLEETCRAMNDLINHGKVLYWGVSEWTAPQIDDAVKMCRANGWHVPVSDQPLYNMLERHWETEVFPMCAKHGMGIVCFSPLAEGLLTGKYNSGVPAGTRAADPKAAQFIAPRMTEQNLERVRKLTAIAESLDCSMAALALAWCLRKAEMTSVIIGASKPEQVIQNARASDVVLQPDVQTEIERLLTG